MTYVVLALGIIATVVFLLLRDNKSSALAICVKAVASLLFVATAICAIIFNNDHTNINAMLLVVFGLVCGLIGDITLDCKVFFKQYESLQGASNTMTYWGMGAFAVGHVAYISAVTLVTGQTVALLYSFVIGLVVTALTFYTTICVLKMKFGKFLLPSILYCCLLAMFFVITVWTLPSYNGGVQGVLLLVGAIMFVVSDLILSYTYFANEIDRAKAGALNPESRLLIVVNHATYYVAQFLIAVSLLFI